MQAAAAIIVAKRPRRDNADRQPRQSSGHAKPLSNPAEPPGRGGGAARGINVGLRLRENENESFGQRDLFV